MDVQKLRNPPIVEAIVDIRVSPIVAVNEAKIFQVIERLGGEYKSVAPLPMREMKFVVKKATLERSEEMRGYIVQSLDGLNKGQFRIDGFAFNRLAPYTSWEDVIRNAQLLWEAYRNNFLPKQIARLAVRYINQMQFATDVESINQYLTVAPNLPPTLQATTRSFLTQATIENIDEQIAATITQTINQDDNIGMTVVALDIDAFSLRKFSASNDQAIWETFELLRKMKNKIFYASLTEKAKETFNQ